MLNDLQNGRCSFIFTTLLALQSQPRNSFSTSANSDLPIPLLLVHKIILTISTNTPCLYTSAIFHLSHTSRTTVPTIYTKNVLATSVISPIQVTSTDQRAREPSEEVWAVITGLTITNSLSLRFRKFIHCRCGKPTNPLSLVLSTYCHYFHILLIPPRELIFPYKPVA